MATPDEQYALLIEVLLSGELTPSTLRRRDGTLPPRPHQTLRVQSSAPISGNEKYLLSVVCFCDIPVEDLALHTAKYSPFGLSFLKRFLIPRGASPVFYVARQSASSIPEYGTRGLARAKFYDMTEPMLRELVETHTRAQQGAAGEQGEGRDARYEAECLRSLVMKEFLPFLKFFDGDMPDDDPDNFYMEREWRVVGRVNFALSDVERIFLPPAYAARFRSDVPDFHGQLTYSS